MFLEVDPPLCLLLILQLSLRRRREDYFSHGMRNIKKVQEDEKAATNSVDLNSSGISTIVSMQSEDVPILEIPSKKPNPITVIGIEDLVKFSVKLDTHGDLNYELSNRGKFTRIYPATIKDQNEIRQVLMDRKVLHYVTEDRTPLFKGVVRGLYLNAPTQEISDALKRLGFEVENIKNLISRRTQKLLPLYLVEIRKNKNSKDILKVRALLKIRVEIEKFRPQKKATQCFKCLHFFHLAANCHMTPRCVCGEKHETHTCPVKKAGGS